MYYFQSGIQNALIRDPNNPSLQPCLVSIATEEATQPPCCQRHTCRRQSWWVGRGSPMAIRQWCTTSGPRATSGPRRVVKWPARPNRKSTISDTALTLKPTHLGLISQHLNDFKLKVQGENQLGYHLANYCSAFKANRCCLHFIHFILST